MKMTRTTLLRLFVVMTMVVLVRCYSLTTNVKGSYRRSTTSISSSKSDEETRLTTQSEFLPFSAPSRSNGRRSFLSAALGAASGVALTSSIMESPSDHFIPAAEASGGATAGKYTTIPIAKRRYYGRVQQAVHEFLLMAPAMVAADSTAPEVQHFFDVKGTVIVAAKRKDVNGQCTKKDGDCSGKEILDSRYNDMKASMYLLGNAFRFNQQKAPDNLPTVQAAKKFFKVMDSMEKQVLKSPKGKDPTAQKLYVQALDILDQYLDLVELPPTDSGHYDQEFDTRVGESSRIT